MDTVSIISRIFFGDAMRATPPCARICAGTRSSAITAAAPERSAISAWRASVTSMITPPLSISARPVLSRKPFPLSSDILSTSRAPLPPVGETGWKGGLNFNSCGRRPRGASRPLRVFFKDAPPLLSPGIGRGTTWRRSSLPEPGPHALRIDGDEDPPAAGEHLAVFTPDLGGVEVPPSPDAALGPFGEQG